MILIFTSCLRAGPHKLQLTVLVAAPTRRALFKGPEKGKGAFVARPVHLPPNLCMTIYIYIYIHNTLTGVRGTTRETFFMGCKVAKQNLGEVSISCQ